MGLKAKCFYTIISSVARCIFKIALWATLCCNDQAVVYTVVILCKLNVLFNGSTQPFKWNYKGVNAHNHRNAENIAKVYTLNWLSGTTHVVNFLFPGR